MARGYIDTPSDADAAVPVGFPKTDTHGGGKFTSEATESGRRIAASTIAIDEMWTYLGAKKEEKRNALNARIA